MPLFPELITSVDQAAPRLLGCLLERTIGSTILIARIVEVEAYNQQDPASHTFRGQTPRNQVMFGPAGHLYVYFTYGMHYCCNVVTGEEGTGAAVLIRAVEPLQGEADMQTRRGTQHGVNISNGPGKVCAALAIDQQLYGHDLSKPPCRLIMQPALPNQAIRQTTRIGISKGQETPWRFFLANNPYVSRPRL